MKWIVNHQKKGHQEQYKLGRGGGQMVGVLAFYSNDPKSNPAVSTVFIL